MYGGNRNRPLNALSSETYLELDLQKSKMQFFRYQVRRQFTVHCNATEAERTKWENLRARLTNMVIDLVGVF